MCTTGVTRNTEDEYLLFKNKDFGREHFDDRLVVERDVFGVEGITTWAGADPDLDRFSGFSIGANSSGVLACDSNVRTLEDHANYDDLVEIGLRGGSDVPSAVDAIRAAIREAPYLWGNLILIDADTSVSVEVKSSQLKVVELETPAVRTNHHVVWGANLTDDDTVTSENRRRSAQARLEQATSTSDVFVLQAAHDDGGTGICNHALHQTVYSYVLVRRSGVTKLLVSQGRPCEDPPRVELTVPLGDRWSPEEAAVFRSLYPSARSKTRV